MVTVTVKSAIRYSYHDTFHRHSVECCGDCENFSLCKDEDKVCCPRCKWFVTCTE